MKYLAINTFYMNSQVKDNCKVLFYIAMAKEMSKVKFLLLIKLFSQSVYSESIFAAQVISFS